MDARGQLKFADAAVRAFWEPFSEEALAKRLSRYEQGERLLSDFRFEFINEGTSEEGAGRRYVPTFLLHYPAENRDISLRLSRRAWARIAILTGTTHRFLFKHLFTGGEVGREFVSAAVRRILTREKHARTVYLFVDDPPDGDTLPERYTVRDALLPHHRGPISEQDLLDLTRAFEGEPEPWRIAGARFSDDSTAYRIEPLDPSSRWLADVSFRYFPRNDLTRLAVDTLLRIPPYPYLLKTKSCLRDLRIGKFSKEEFCSAIDRALLEEDEYHEGEQERTAQWDNPYALGGCLVDIGRDRGLKRREIMRYLRYLTRVAEMAPEYGYSRKTAAIAAYAFSRDIDQPVLSFRFERIAADIHRTDNGTMRTTRSARRLAKEVMREARREKVEIHKAAARQLENIERYLAYDPFEDDELLAFSSSGKSVPVDDASSEAAVGISGELTGGSVS